VDADEADDVRRGVGQGVKAVRQNADRAARVSKRDLRGRHDEIEEKHSDEDLRDRGVTIGIRDSGLGIRLA
jgi:hypothetical protein